MGAGYYWKMPQWPNANARSTLSGIDQCLLGTGSLDGFITFLGLCGCCGFLRQRGGVFGGCSFGIDFCGGNGSGGQYGKRVTFHLRQTTVNHIKLFFPVRQIQSQGADAEFRQNGSAIGQDAHQTIMGREDYLSDLLVHNLLFRC